MFSQVVKELSQMHTNMIVDAFYLCGYDMDYIERNLEEFFLERIEDDELYYHDGKLLFTIYTIYDMDTNIIEFKVKFAKGAKK